jgi:putative MATE family efflux protein
MFASSVTIILLFMINGIFRGAGNAAIAMKSLWLANIINIVLDPILIFGWGPFPEMGITGAAVATCIGRGTGVVYQLYHLQKSSLQIRYLTFRPNWDIIGGLTKIASPATFQFVIASASWIVLAAIVATFGSEASAGYQTAIRILIFFILPAWGLSNAAATLVGQNLGAGSALRAEQSVVKTAQYNAVFMGIVTVFFLFFSPLVISFFITDQNSDQYMYALNALRIISAGYIFYGIGMVVTQAFNGAGDTRTPTVINFCCFWLFQIPLAYILTQYFDYGPNGAFIAIPVAETLIAIIGIYIFRRGKWKQVQV